MLATGCSNSVIDTTGSHPRPMSVGSSSPTTVIAERSAAPSQALPAAVDRTARAFTSAYAEHDARDGRDRAYADAGVRAAGFAAGGLVDVLAQERPGQDAPWAVLRAEQARQRVEISSVVVPDGAPAVTSASALVRVGYVLVTTPKSGPSRRSSEQLVLRLEYVGGGWRVTALPWV